MREESFGEARVDVCAGGCRGLWFEWGELRRVDGHRKGAGPALARALKAEPRPVDDERVLACPACEVEMEVTLYEPHPSLRIDQCADCGGVFLDAGELACLRDRPPTKREATARRLRRRRRRNRRLSEEQRRRAGAMVGAMVGLLI